VGAAGKLRDLGLQHGLPSFFETHKGCTVRPVRGDYLRVASRVAHTRFGFGSQSRSYLETRLSLYAAYNYISVDLTSFHLHVRILLPSTCTPVDRGSQFKNPYIV